MLNVQGQAMLEKLGQTLQLPQCYRLHSQGFSFLRKGSFSVVATMVNQTFGFWNKITYFFAWPRKESKELKVNEETEVGRGRVSVK